jgi:hypothetical protein
MISICCVSGRLATTGRRNPLALPTPSKVLPDWPPGPPLPAAPAEGEVLTSEPEQQAAPSIPFGSTH